MSGIKNIFQPDKPEVFVGKSGAKTTNKISTQPFERAKTKSYLENEDSTSVKKAEPVDPLNPFSREPVYISDLKYKRHYEGEKPIPGMSTNLRGRSFDDTMYNASLTTYKIGEEIITNDKVNSNPYLKDATIEFLKVLSPKDKEAVMYTKSLLTRTPDIKADDLKDIFTKLTAMMKEPNYDSKITNVKELVVSALHDIAEPSDISQEGIGTCTGTTIQIQLAIRSPKEYLNMIDSLAKNQPYTTITGKKIDPNWTFIDENLEGKHDSRRTISAKIMQNAIMDYANGPTVFDSSRGDGGLTYEQTSGTIKDIMNQNITTYEIWSYSPKQLVELLKQSNPSIDNPIEISMTYQETGRDAFHSLSAVGIQDGKINIVNPWGREESFAIEEFEKRVMSVSGTKDLNIGINKVNVSDSQIQNNILDDTKRDAFLNTMNNNQKADRIAALSDLHFYTNPPSNKILSANDKIEILYLLNSLINNGPAQSDRLFKLILNTVGNTNVNILMSRINDNSTLYETIKTKMDDLILRNSF